MSFKSEFAGINWLYLFVALLMALGLWYTLNAREEIERVVDVRLDYKGLPPGLIVTGGQLNKVSVRFRGPKELLRSMTNRELSYTMDLSGVTAGRNVIPLTTSYKPPELRAYEVLEVAPSRMILEVDKITEKSLPVQVSLRASPAAPSVRLRDMEVEPDHVTVRGPAGAIASLKEITAEIPVDLDAEGRAVTEQVPLLAPPAVEISPQVAKVTWRLDVRRRTISIQRDVLFDGDADLSVEPSRVNLLVSVPQAFVKDTGYLAQFQVSVPADAPLPQGDGKVNVPVQATEPKGGRVIKINPDQVTIVRHLPAEETGEPADTKPASGENG